MSHGDLGADSPWPAFGRRAIEEGLASVHAFPMRVRDKVLGTLNLFMAEAGPLTSADVSVAQALARAATIALLQDRAAADANRLTAVARSGKLAGLLVEIDQERSGVVAQHAVMVEHRV